MVRTAQQFWRPLGQLVDPQAGEAAWWASHASYPTALVGENGLVTVFFSVRDAQNRSSLAAIDISIDGDAIERAGPVRGPLLAPGPRGAFDADGVTVTSLVRDGDRLLAYYLGWTVGGSAQFANFIGLAVSDGSASHFTRASPAPIIGRSRENPFTLSYPWVLRRGPSFHMWFGTHLSWGAGHHAMEHVVKEARSNNGVDWTADPQVVIPLAGTADPAEFAISRPTVIEEPDQTLSMWYARRAPGYALGCAVLKDAGKAWQRTDEALVMLGKPEAWEDAERTYPCVFDHLGRRYMLYNGNGYGRSGFGIAILER